MNSAIQIVYANEQYLRSFYDALTTVAAERIYIEMIEPPPFEKVAEFQRGLFGKDGPVFYAVENDKVVGWCDVFPEVNPRLCHRGGLGMGLLPPYRGLGIGGKLLASTLDQAKKFGIEKVELNVYSTNTPAIALYKKFGFEQEGLIRKYRKLEGQYFDCIAMGRFL